MKGIWRRWMFSCVSDRLQTWRKNRAKSRWVMLSFPQILFCGCFQFWCFLHLIFAPLSGQCDCPRWCHRAAQSSKRVSEFKDGREGSHSEHSQIQFLQGKITKHCMVPLEKMDPQFSVFSCFPKDLWSRNDAATVLWCHAEENDKWCS